MYWTNIPTDTKMVLLFEMSSKKIWKDQKDIWYSPSICHYWNRPGLSPPTCSPWKIIWAPILTLLVKPPKAFKSFGWPRLQPAHWVDRGVPRSGFSSLSPAASPTPRLPNHLAVSAASVSSFLTGSLPAQTIKMLVKRLRITQHSLRSQYAMSTCWATQ